MSICYNVTIVCTKINCINDFPTAISNKTSQYERQGFRMPGMFLSVLFFFFRTKCLFKFKLMTRKPD